MSTPTDGTHQHFAVTESRAQLDWLEWVAEPPVSFSHTETLNCPEFWESC